MVLMGLRLVQQHGRALQQAEAGKAQLEQRVREATAEIERNFRQLAELRVEQVTERERKRIAADLHDDLGAKLLTIVHTSESDRISTLAREALEEMRLSVRGLTGRRCGWPTRWATGAPKWCRAWRRPASRRLGSARRPAADAVGTGLRADHAHPARGHQQHHQAQRRVALQRALPGQADGDFQLVVQDNGDGISTEIDGRLDRGHGMATHEAARQADAGAVPGGIGPGLSEP
jgi:two-component system sensor histidine kinase UhpB